MAAEIPPSLDEKRAKLNNDVFQNGDRLRLLVRDYVKNKFNVEAERSSRADLLIRVGEIYPMPLHKIAVYDEMNGNEKNDSTCASSPNEKDSLSSTIEKKIFEFYEIYDKNVRKDYILRQIDEFKGREEVLLRKLASKYKRKMKNLLKKRTIEDFQVEETTTIDEESKATKPRYVE